MKSILIVRLGALGDIVHALPAAAALRDAFPEARIDWLVDARYRAVLDLVPVLDHRVSVDSRAWSGAKAPFTVIRELRRARYEIAFDLQGLIKSAALARLSGASRVVGYTTKHLREPAARLFYTEQVNPRVDEAEEEDEAEASGRGGYRAPALATVARARTTTVLHMVHRSVAALRAIGINRPELRFPLDEPPSAAPACTRQLLGLWPDEPFALINPGAAWPNKRWPAARFGALARELRARHGLKSAVLWGPEEETLAAQVAAASDGAAEMAPLTSVADMIALARAARVLISGDTGPIHLAAAVGTAVAGALLVGLLSTIALGKITASPTLTPELQVQVDLNNITFVSNDRLRTVLQSTTGTPQQVDEAVRVNTEARLRALKIGLLIMAGLAMLAIIPAGGLPNYRPGEIPDDETVNRRERTT